MFGTKKKKSTAKKGAAKRKGNTGEKSSLKTTASKPKTAARKSAASKSRTSRAALAKRSSAKTAAKKPAAAKTKTAAKKKTASKPKTQINKPAARKPAASKTGAKKKSTTAARSKTGVKKKSATAARSKTGVKKKSAAAARSKTGVKKKSATAARNKASAASAKAAAKKPAARRAVKKVVKKSGHKPITKPPFEAYKGIRPYMFCSYAHRDMTQVFKVLKKLHKDRYRIWYDEGIEPGNEWPEVVGNAVIKCSQFIVFMSPAAASSRNVRNEVNLAFNDDKEIIVVYLKKSNLSSGMRLQIGTVQFINYYDITDREFYVKLNKVLSSSLRN
jgi:hypothetical protein